MTSRRIDHLTEKIHQKLSAIIQREANDPRFTWVTITGVKLANDQSFATVTYTCFKPTTDIDSLTASLNRAAGFFSHALGRSLKSRSTPKLRFDYDPGFDYAQEMDELLANLHDAEGNPT